MDKKDHILVKVPVNGIRESLVKIISSEHARLITNVIIEQLNHTEIGLDKLYMALSGVPFTYRFNILDEVWVNIDHLPGWRMNKDAMVKANLLKNNAYIKCTINKISPHRKHCYNVQFNILKPGETEVSLEEYDITEDAVIDQYPEMEGDTLPF